jgi:hypothetical protein
MKGRVAAATGSRIAVVAVRRIAVVAVRRIVAVVVRRIAAGAESRLADRSRTEGWGCKADPCLRPARVAPVRRGRVCRGAAGAGRWRIWSGASQGCFEFWNQKSLTSEKVQRYPGRASIPAVSSPLTVARTGSFRIEPVFKAATGCSSTRHAWYLIVPARVPVQSMPEVAPRTGQPH